MLGAVQALVPGLELCFLSLNPPNTSETALCYPHFAAGVTGLQKGTQADSAETEQLGR